MHTRTSDRGFTLIEVLVALAIVAIGMAAILGTLTSSASTVIYMRDKSLANWVALNHIAEQRLLPSLPPLGKSDGDVDYAGQKWHWHQEVIETAVKGMFRIDVMVRPADSKADDDKGWYVTLSGVTGDAFAQPTGMPPWDVASGGGPNPGGGNPGGGNPGGGNPGGGNPGGGNPGGGNPGGGK
jgi:general secretion pathway protein I